MKRLLILTLFAALLPVAASAQMLTAGTNVALDGMKAFNIGFAMTTGNRTTLGLNGIYAKDPMLLDDGKIWAIQPEWKYYLSGRPLHGFFVGIGGIAADYKAHRKRKHYDGNAVGAGLLFGYVVNLGKRANVDFHGSFGAIRYKQKEYFDGDNYDDYSVGGRVQANAKGTWFAPTDIGITLSYILR